MITLDLSNPFTFKLRDQDGNEKDLSGTFREFTKKEQIDFKKKNEVIEATVKKGQGFISKIQRNNKLIEIKEKREAWDEVEKLISETNKLEDDLQKLTETFNAEQEKSSVLSKRFDICLGGDNKKEIIELAETQGYDKVFEVIAKAIREGKSND